MVMARIIPATVALTLLSSVDEYKKVMAHMLSFIQYFFVNHFKSTTTYLLINYPIFIHYHPPEADIPLLMHENNIWKSRILLIIVINMFKK